MSFSQVLKKNKRHSNSRAVFLWTVPIENRRPGWKTVYLKGAKVTLRSLMNLNSVKQRMFFQTFLISPYTVKLARAKLPASAGNFTSSSQVKMSHAQFNCATCSLPVKTGKYTCFEAASTSRRILACKFTWIPQAFTGSYTCGTHANLPRPVSAGKNTCNLKAKTLESQVKTPHNRRQKNLQFHAELPAIAGNLLSHRG